MPKAVCAAAIVLALGRPAGLFAQGYPERPVRFIIALAAGGSADIVGRLLAQKLGQAARRRSDRREAFRGDA